MLDHVRRTDPVELPDDGYFAAPLSVPAVDIAETDEGLEISAEVPGVSEEELDVTIVGDVLVLKGEKNENVDEKKRDYHLVERRYGSFRRSIPLGFVPEKEAVTAAFSDGVLKLKIARPVDAESGVQRVSIAKG